MSSFVTIHYSTRVDRTSVLGIVGIGHTVGDAGMKFEGVEKHCICVYCKHCTCAYTVLHRISLETDPISTEQ